MNSVETENRQALATSPDGHRYIERIDVFNLRMSLRAESYLSATIRSVDGATTEAETRDVSVSGIGFVHNDRVPLGEAIVTVFSRRRDFSYRMEITWCRPFENETYLSGGRFLNDIDDFAESED